jgi:ferredoxin
VNILKYKLVYKKSECIGAGACEAMAPELWFFDKETSIATLKSAETKRVDGIEELEFDEKDFEKFLDSARVCPVRIIEIYDETGKKIYPD